MEKVISSRNKEYTKDTAGCRRNTYPVERKGMAAIRAAQTVLFYYIGMTAGRLRSGILATKLSCRKSIHIGLAVLGAAVVILLLPVPAAGIAVGSFMVGLASIKKTMVKHGKSYTGKEKDRKNPVTFVSW